MISTLLLKFHLHSRNITSTEGIITNLVKATICYSSQFMTSILIYVPYSRFCIMNLFGIQGDFKLKSKQCWWTKEICLSYLSFGNGLSRLNFSVKGRLLKNYLCLCCKTFHKLSPIKSFDLSVLTVDHGTWEHQFKFDVSHPHTKAQRHLFWLLFNRGIVSLLMLLRH